MVYVYDFICIKISTQNVNLQEPPNCCSQLLVTNWLFKVQYSLEFVFLFCLCFPDTANGYKQAEHNLASDLPPRSGCSLGTLTPTSAHQPSHCKMLSFTFSESHLTFHH